MEHDSQSSAYLSKVCWWSSGAFNGRRFLGLSSQVSAVESVAVSQILIFLSVCGITCGDSDFLFFQVMEMTVYKETA